MAGAGAAMADDLYVLQANLNNTIAKIMEMESQIESQEQEVLNLEMLVKESESYSDLKFELERSSGLEVLSVSDEFLKIRITSPVPTMQTNSPNHRGKYEHELAIKLDTTTMTIEAVQLMPEDVPYEDLEADVKTLSVLHKAPLLVNGGQGWSKQIFSLISRIRQRIYANILRNEMISVSAKYPRYKLKYSPEANLVTATLPGPLTANIAIPYGWPMPGFSLHLNSLVPSSKRRHEESTDVLLQCVDLANSSPESQSPDILQFLQAIEKIYLSKRKEPSNH
ncbi:hypothetical protein KC19_4G206900 [Ceratodon purpureus]|uniref:Uncharacterized protein n=1 Tax=Ceratodon purpureus TaxID=3225 RepID=A0A8T0IEI1_CERPU|nr:hypothetical protein KC19_4G206900 [Ceratodon purpureus]